MNSRMIVLLGTIVASAMSAHAVRGQLTVSGGDLTLETALGSDPNGPLFHRIRGATLSERGELFVLDLMNYSIRVFDRSGKQLREFGRQAVGPGEFQEPMKLRVQDGMVSVEDLTLRRVSIFTEGGDHVNTSALPQTPAASGQQGARRSNRSLAALRFGMSVITDQPMYGYIRDQKVNPHSYVVLLAASGQRMDTLARYEGPGTAIVGNPRNEPGVLNGFGIHSFGMMGFWVTDGDSVVASIDGRNGLLTLFGVDRTGGRKIGSMSLGWSMRTVDASSLLPVLQQQMAQARGGRASDWEMSLPAYYGQVAGMFFDSRGRIWVRHVPDPPSRARGLWNVVDWRSGVVVARVQEPEGFSLSAVQGDRLVGIYRDQLGVETVHVYRAPSF